MDSKPTPEEESEAGFEQRGPLWSKAKPGKVAAFKRENPYLDV